MSADAIPTLDNEEFLTDDQRLLHEKLITDELERQAYVEDDDDY